MLKALLVSGAVVVAASASAATPATPLMPAYFWATFDLVGGDGYATTGAFYYDSTLAAYRVDRLNGIGDGICGSVLPQNTSCTQLVNNGIRYIVYPEVRYCCSCCNETQGCGFLSREWLVNANATFVGTTTVNGVLGNVWTMSGGDSYIAVANSDPVAPQPLLISDPPNNETFTTYYPVPPPFGTFEVPSYCQEQCPASSVCGEIPA